MGEIEKLEGMLSPYRVLDLTDEKGLLCGKLLGDLGADVIKIERPGGDSARSLGPFYHDEVDPEKSLFWFAFNTSKRGITLDIETADGQEIFKRLVKSADFVIESFPPGYMEELGLGYSTLERINPGVILVSITPFGQTGPYKDYKAPDIVAWAMGGQMYPFGDADRPPVRISHPCQAYLHTGAEAAIGAMMALFYREMTGEGQQVDVSIQASVAKLAYGASMVWDSMKMTFQRGGQLIPTINIIRMWPCKDGYVMWFYFMGTNAKRWNLPFIEWMESEGMGDDFLREFDWEIVDFTTITQEKIDRIAEPTRKFFMSHTKAELLEGSVKHNVLLFPVSTTADILESAQLAARRFWAELEHPELGTTITYPGAFAHASEAPPRVSRRAPLIGEHNQEVYKELGISMDKPLTLKRDGGYSVQISKKNPKKNLDERPLDGVKVADFTWWAAAPLATKTLAQYGAEVLRIEGRSRPDLHRIHPPFKDGIPGENRGGGFNWANTGKLSIALNLAHPKGLELAKRFVAWADIVVESFAGGVMERMGLGYEELKKIKPDIIMLSSCIQGQTGPHAAHPGFGPHLTALSGFAHIAGWPDREPVELGNYTDFIAPYFNALAPLAALDYRRRTGKGQYLDLSQYENAIHFLAPLILDHTANGRVANRMGNRSPDAAPHGAYRCRGEDRWCAIAVFTDEEWRSFCEVIGNPAWTRKPEFATLQARKENEEELDRLVEEWTINYSPEEVMTMMQMAGVGAGLLATGEDLVEHDPQLRHRHFFHELDHPEVGKYYPIGSACVLSKSPGKLQRAPLLGEHNEYAFKEILGMSDGEIAELVIEGVIE
jgi:crotonobetainyl-CoA:carnitine CoA-transferase CaiB-like acyl-CoA transferase